MNQKLAIGIDLGGTNIKGALVDTQGSIHSKKEVPTPVSLGPEAVARSIAELIRDFEIQARLNGADLLGAGIGIPGLPDKDKGSVIFAPNLGWKNFNLVKVLKTTFNLPILLENDANTAALGEQWLGAGRGSANMIMITIGTGIGGGLIINGSLYTGANGSAGEIGHTVINPEGPLCNCGRRGCLETLTSAKAMVRMAKEALAEGKPTSLAGLPSLEAVDVVQHAKNGDEVALKIVNLTAHYLGIGIANLINVFNPDTVVIGGGVSKAGPILFDPLNSSVLKWSMEAPVGVVKIVPAKLGNDAGSLGAGSLVIRAN